MAGHEPPSTLTWVASDRPIARGVAQPIRRFLGVEAAGGLLLILATVIALVWANSPWKDSYHDLWETRVTFEIDGLYSLEEHGVEGDEHADEAAASDEAHDADESLAAEEPHDEEGSHSEEGSHGISLEALVNDALMVIFFFVVGLEIKRELVDGYLVDRRAAALPAMAAIGGMVVPALVFFAFNTSGAAADGWGIPMATDIAFAVGVLSLLGNRVPSSLKVFLLTLAIVDDIGAILVIAIFYSSGLSFGWLAFAIAIVAVIMTMRQVRIWFVPAYVVAGCVLWLAVFESGVHATIAGVVLGLITPARPLQASAPEEIYAPITSDGKSSPADVRRAVFYSKESVSVAERLESAIHPYSSYVIIPIFALANAGIELSGEALSDAATSPLTLGVVFGLVLGKLVGVTAFTYVAARMNLSPLPAGTTMRHIVGVAAVAGIGFTVSLFITGLAFEDAGLQDEAKIGILVASALAAIIGMLVLRGVDPVDETLDDAVEAQ